MSMSSPIRGSSFLRHSTPVRSKTRRGELRPFACHAVAKRRRVLRHFHSSDLLGSITSTTSMSMSMSSPIRGSSFLRHSTPVRSKTRRGELGPFASRAVAKRKAGASSFHSSDLRQRICRASAPACHSMDRQATRLPYSSINR